MSSGLRYATERSFYFCFVPISNCLAGNPVKFFREVKIYLSVLVFYNCGTSEGMDSLNIVHRRTEFLCIECLTSLEIFFMLLVGTQ